MGLLRDKGREFDYDLEARAIDSINEHHAKENARRNYP
jgi:hypothetical protein